MANPQLEDGYTRIADLVLEALMKAKLTGTQWDLVMVIIRMTWGYQKIQYIRPWYSSVLLGYHLEGFIQGMPGLFVWRVGRWA